jgi:hypothetical protein
MDRSRTKDRNQTKDRNRTKGRTLGMGVSVRDKTVGLGSPGQISAWCNRLGVHRAFAGTLQSTHRASRVSVDPYPLCRVASKG